MYLYRRVGVPLSVLHRSAIGVLFVLSDRVDDSTLEVLVQFPKW